MDADANVGVVLEVFAAIEQRDTARFLAHTHPHTHPQVSICWPPSLPWNDGLPGRPDKDGHHGRSWLEVWAPLQPTAAERQLHPEVIAAADDRVVVRWHQRGRSPAGLSFDGQVLGLYEVQQERLARAQMFYLALLRCAGPGQTEVASSTRDQIAKISSSNATASRLLVGSSAASS